METFKRVKVAVAGFKSSHVLEMFNIIKTSPYYDLVAVSFDKETKERIEKSYHDEKYFDEYPYYYSDEEMFVNHPEIELCICGAENSEHFRQYKLCAKRWINVIMMKVPTLDMEEYDEMLRLEKESGIIVASNVNIDERSISREDENGKIINSNAWFVAPYSPSKNPSTPKVSCTFNVRVRAMESGKTYISVNVSNISAITTIAQFNPHTFITTYRDVATQCEPTGKFENDLLNLFR